MRQRKTLFLTGIWPSSVLPPFGHLGAKPLNGEALGLAQERYIELRTRTDRGEVVNVLTIGGITRPSMASSRPPSECSKKPCCHRDSSPVISDPKFLTRKQGKTSPFDDQPFQQRNGRNLSEQHVCTGSKEKAGTTKTESHLNIT